MADTIRIPTISAYHAMRGLPPPDHPLVSVVRFEEMTVNASEELLVNDFYAIGLKQHVGADVRYGRQLIDFDRGTLFCMAPGQVYHVGIKKSASHGGWYLMVHPDFLWGSELANRIGGYEYFGYSIREALHLSAREEETVVTVLRTIRQEVAGNLDEFSQDIVVTHLAVLLSYAERFYRRQFLTRKQSNHEILDRLDRVLDEALREEVLATTGVPAVQDVARSLNVSPNYLSGVLQTLTGRSTQDHIHERLIARAKTTLSTTHHSVSEIAYALGFRHPQSFSKLFRSKTGQTPTAFRAAFS
ncbi:helix-turn-helix domain-containing protein [Lewinella sp. IMCC34183]|uniref:helix-turn-helix domain-containing protein n=1 Tax=Lewinella sp. IMCC34183 TaxID=2248762 RepID=UPI000E25B414|nr:helix-turn-helix transcriptional regulator [Lewinella sp. IMCC34183]